MIVLVGENFDEAVIHAINFAYREVFVVNDDFATFLVAREEILLVHADGGDAGVGIGEADKTIIIYKILGTSAEICCKDGGFILGALCRRFTADTVADSVDVFCGGLK